jgi:alpha-L-fucosidase 2
VLGCDEDRVSRWREILEKLPPLQVGRHGQLQEWLEDYTDNEPGHRHISHLYAFHPGDAITVEDEPRLAEAARVSLQRRLAGEGGHTGWSRAWTVCQFARLGEGEACREHLVHLLADFATDAMLDLHPPRIFQIDGNFGGSAGVAEMLLQSHRGVIRLLPALPAAWGEGRYAGLRARGGVRVDARWSGGAPTEALLHAGIGGPVTVQHPRIAEARVTCDGGEVAVEPAGRADRITFDTQAGRNYRLSWSR